LHFIGRFAPGKSVLWHAGASGVSIAGIQLSKRAGASAIYATAGSNEKCGFIEKELGATKAFNYKTQDWSQEILRLTGGGGVDLVIDFIGADYFQKNLDVSALGGTVVCLGLMSGSKVNDVDISQIVYKRIRIEGSTLRSRDENYQATLRDKLEDYLPQFESGEFKVYVDKILPWEEIIQAHKFMEKGDTMGKIICTIS
jgi:NADPH:quinone reductase-like Zn-dependent oxidoreductase